MCFFSGFNVFHSSPVQLFFDPKRLHQASRWDSWNLLVASGETEGLCEAVPGGRRPLSNELATRGCESSQRRDANERGDLGPENKKCPKTWGDFSVSLKLKLRNLKCPKTNNLG